MVPKEIATDVVPARRKAVMNWASSFRIVNDYFIQLGNTIKTMKSTFASITSADDIRQLSLTVCRTTIKAYTILPQVPIAHRYQSEPTTHGTPGDPTET